MRGFAMLLLLAVFAPISAAQVPPTQVERSRYSGLLAAAARGDAGEIERLTAAGQPVDVHDAHGRTPLHVAAYFGHRAAMRALVAAGAPLDHVNNLGWTALIESIVLGDGDANHTATLKALVDAGADVNLAERGGRTPLELAQARGYPAMVALLAMAGAR